MLLRVLLRFESYVRSSIIQYDRESSDGALDGALDSTAMARLTFAADGLDGKRRRADETRSMVRLTLSIDTHDGVAHGAQTTIPSVRITVVLLFSS
jgi:hypothetical protein